MSELTKFQGFKDGATGLIPRASEQAAPEYYEGYLVGVYAYNNFDKPRATGVEARVCEDIANRQQLGIAKYKTTLQDNKAPRVERIRHAYQEATDLACYLRWELDKAEAEHRETIEDAEASIAWLKETADKKKVTPAKIIVDIEAGFVNGIPAVLDHLTGMVSFQAASLPFEGVGEPMSKLAPFNVHGAPVYCVWFEPKITDTVSL